MMAGREKLTVPELLASTPPVAMEPPVVTSERTTSWIGVAELSLEQQG